MNTWNNPGYIGWQPNYGNSPVLPSMPRTPMDNIVSVNGENGAKAYQMPPNSRILLLDESAPVVWLKTTDGAGYPSLTGYTITPIETARETEAADTSAKFKDLTERLSRLETVVYERTNHDKSYYSKAKRSERGDGSTATE